MKKVLLGSTALVAAGLIAGHAAAADGVKLSLGGYYRGVAGVMFDDFDGAAAGLEDDLRDYVFKQDVEVHFKGETTLDNGLTVGAVVQLEGQTSGDQIDEVYAYFSGGWGELRFGDDDEALISAVFDHAERRGQLRPGLAVLQLLEQRCSRCVSLCRHQRHLLWHGRRLHEAHLLQPELGAGSASRRRSRRTVRRTRAIQSAALALGLRTTRVSCSDNVSLAANFNHDFNGVTLNIGGGATWNLDREGLPGVDETEEYQGYASVGFFGFTIGGAIDLRNNFGVDGSDRLVYGAGLTYNWDAWTVGIGWTHGDYEIAQLTALTLTSDAEQNQDIFALTAAYALGPGITVDGVVEWVNSETDAGALSNEYQGISFGLGTLISF